MCEMIDVTIRNLSNYLDSLEWRVLEDTNMCHANGGYCNADHDGHDNEYIYIKVVWGECTDECKTANPEHYKIARRVINDCNLTFEQKYIQMQDE